MSEGQLSLTLVGWGLAALGVVTILRSIVGPIVGYSLASNLMLGVTSVVLAVAVQRARDFFGETSKKR
jgi:hypothetical protein